MHQSDFVEQTGRQIAEFGFERSDFCLEVGEMVGVGDDPFSFVGDIGFENGDVFGELRIDLFEIKVEIGAAEECGAVSTDVERREFFNAEGGMVCCAVKSVECAFLLRPDGYVAFRCQPVDEAQIVARLEKIFVPKSG